MLVGVKLRLRCLPEGAEHLVSVLSIQERVIEIELPFAPTGCSRGDAVELTSDETIYLGIIEHRLDEQDSTPRTDSETRAGTRLWVNVEHMMDRRELSRIQSAWKETEGQKESSIRRS